MQIPSLRQIEYLVAVAELGHFGGAARRCGVSQPALSKQVQEAEGLLGVQFFERARGGARLTREGEALLPQLRRILGEARELELRAQSQRRGVERRATLGVIPTLAPYLLPGLFPLLRAWSPGFQWRFYEAKTASLFEKLASGAVDVVLAGFPVSGDEFDGVDLYREPLVLVSPAGEAPMGSDADALEQLRGRTALLMEAGHCFREHAQAWCTRVGVVDDAVIHTNSLSTLALMARQGLGVTLLPASALGVEALPPQEVTLRSFRLSPPTRVVGLRWRATSARGALFASLAEPLLALLPALEARIPEEIEGPRPRFEVLWRAP